MNEKLFDMNPNLDRTHLEQAAQELGLDMGRFKKALDTNAHEERIKRDQQLVNSLGASGTPAFFINGRKLVGAVPFDNFKTLIDEELAKAEAMEKAGTPKKDIYQKIIEKGATATVFLPGSAPQPAQPQQPPPSNVKKVTLRGDEPLRGPKFAKVTIAEWSDFQ